MDSWWAELESTLSVEIKGNHKTELEELTGCNPILLNPVLSSSRVTPDSRSPDSDEHYAETIEHLFATLETSDEVRNVRTNISAFVNDKHAKLPLEPAKWKS
jgi:hypothetical protein